MIMVPMLRNLTSKTTPPMALWIRLYWLTWCVWAIWVIWSAICLQWYFLLTSSSGIINHQWPSSPFNDLQVHFSPRTSRELKLVHTGFVYQMCGWICRKKGRLFYLFIFFFVTFPVIGLQWTTISVIRSFVFTLDSTRLI